MIASSSQHNYIPFLRAGNVHYDPLYQSVNTAIRMVCTISRQTMIPDITVHTTIRLVYTLGRGILTPCITQLLLLYTLFANLVGTL